MDSTKSPVSWLHEICTRYRVLENYKFEEVPAGKENGLTYFRCTINLSFKGNIYVEIGIGQSKKNAKRSAAHSMLKGMEVFATEELEKMHYKPSREDNNPVNETNNFFQNESREHTSPISYLQSICFKLRLPQPVYMLGINTDTFKENRLPKKFSMSCHVGDEFVQTAEGCSKKSAKHNAAKQMAEFLQTLNVELKEDDLEGQDEDTIFAMIRETKNNAKNKKEGKDTGRKLRENSGFRVYDCYRRGVPGPQLDKLFTNPMDPEDPIKFLADLGKEQGFDITYFEIDEKTTDDTFHCLIMLPLEPEAILKGEGVTEQEAKVNSAIDALNYLRRIMLKAVAVAVDD